jgi:hypothetical protein
MKLIFESWRKHLEEAVSVSINKIKDLACPPATQNLELNTKNRDAAVQAEHIQYGPLNVDEPGDYWNDIADAWNTSEEAAKKSLCGNCVAFDISPRMKDCMPGETSDKDGQLGYCWMHHFKCHSARSCRTWAKGGPITEDTKSMEWQEKNKSSLEEEVEQYGVSNIKHAKKDAKELGIATESKKDVKVSINKKLDAEGGAAGLGPLLQAAKEVDPDITKDEVIDILNAMSNVDQHKDGDYVDTAELKEAVGIFLEMKEELLDEKKRKKKKKSKKKKKGKKDACYHKVKARYDVWPSAYASGALVKCRKVGAANWGNKSKKNEHIELEKEDLLQILEEEIENVLNEKCWPGYEKKGMKTMFGKRVPNCVKKTNEEAEEELEEKRKLTAKPGSESSLRDWFGRKGEKGKKGGWVDCNTCRKDKKTGKKTCKACGRSGEEKRAKYPSCRPTPAACGTKGNYGKKSKAGKKG